MHMKTTMDKIKAPKKIRLLVGYKVLSFVIVLLCGLIDLFGIAEINILKTAAALMIIEIPLILRRFECPHCHSKNWRYAQKVMFFYIADERAQKLRKPACPKCGKQYE